MLSEMNPQSAVEKLASCSTRPIFNPRSHGKAQINSGISIQQGSLEGHRSPKRRSPRSTQVAVVGFSEGVEDGFETTAVQGILGVRARRPASFAKESWRSSKERNRSA